jgi:fructokinase
MRIGVDLGGTKIEIIALDDSGTVLLRRRVATPRGDYAATIGSIADLVAAAERELGRRGSIGVATPGAISTRTGLMKNANSTVLNGRPLQRDLTELLGRPVRIANDANCFTLSEAVDGAAAGAHAVFGVILGTGVGGGIVIGGRPLEGRNRIAGEWGHNPLPWPTDQERPGPACYCGKAGCIETFLSGAGLARACLASGRAPRTSRRAPNAATPGRSPASVSTATAWRAPSPPSSTSSTPTSWCWAADCPTSPRCIRVLAI